MRVHRQPIKKGDALRQMQRLRDYAAARGYQVVTEATEIASSLNDERPKLKKLLTDARVGVLVVERRDRLTPIGYSYIATLLEHEGHRVEAIFPTDTGDDLVDDYMAVITSTAAHIYGRRNAKHRATQIHACVKCCVEQTEEQAKEPCAPSNERIKPSWTSTTYKPPPVGSMRSGALGMQLRPGTRPRLNCGHQYGQTRRRFVGESNRLWRGELWPAPCGPGETVPVEAGTRCVRCFAIEWQILENGGTFGEGSSASRKR
jgi:hypothetical protein